MNKNPLAAFLLSFIPGAGHLYMGRYIRALLYAGAFFGPIFLLMLLGFGFNHVSSEFAFFMMAISLGAAVVNMIDMIISLLTRRTEAPYGTSAPWTNGSAVSYGPDGTPYYGAPYPGDAREGAERAGGMPGPGQPSYGSSPYLAHAEASRQQNERFMTILLSFIPGLGHFQMGLMQRGLTFLVGFFGLFAMTAFVSYMTRTDGFFIFLLGLPVIMFYGMFDAIQLLHRKQRGEAVQDRSIFEELEQSRQDGRKSKLVAMFLSVFPGAGHLYLGLQRRGLQLMAGFLISIYIMDVLRLSIFMFLIPIIWFFSLFDAMQQVSKHGQESLEDIPVVGWLLHHQKWLGVALIAFGAYYLLDRVALRLIERAAPELHVTFYFHEYLQLFIVSTLLIGGGLRLLLGGGSGKKGGGGGGEARGDGA